MPIVENCAVPDVFATGMTDPEDLGNGNTRYTFYVQRRSIHDGSFEREVVCRLVVPEEVARINVRKTIAAWCGGVLASACNCCRVVAH